MYLRNFYGILSHNQTVDGFYLYNDVVDECVMIQATSRTEFEDIATRILEDHSEFCECCGERWDIYYVEDGTEIPTINNESVYEYTKSKSWGANAAILHHYDGKVERVKFKSG